MTTFKLSLTDIRSNKPSDYSVNRLYPNPKIALDKTPAHIGIIKVDVISGPDYNFGDIITWYSFPHGYEDYIPAVVGLFIGGQDGFTDGGILPYTAFGALGQVLMDADEKNINIKFESFDLFGGSPLPEVHFRIRYYVFAEEGRPVS